MSKQSKPPPLCLYVVYLIDLSLSVSSILSVCSYMSVYEKCVFVRVYCTHGILKSLLVQIQSPFGPKIKQVIYTFKLQNM